MKSLLAVLVLLLAGVVSLGFYRGWFIFVSETRDGSANVILMVDKDKFQEDREAAMQGMKGAGPNPKEKAADRGPVNWDGTMVRVSGGELTMTDENGKEHKYSVATDVEVTCDGKVCKAAAVKPGMRIRVTTEKLAPHAVIRIEAIDKNAVFEKATLP